MAPGGEAHREVVVELVDRRVVLDRARTARGCPAPGPPTAGSGGTARRGGSRRSTATGGRPRPRAARSSSRRGPGRRVRSSSQTRSADASPQSRPSRRATSNRIHRSSRASPGGSIALWTRWTRRSELVTVPSVSAHAGGGRQDDVGDLRRRGQEDVLDDEEVEAHQAPLDEVPVRLRLQRVLAEDVQRRELAAVHRLEHVREVPAALRRDLAAPDRLATARGPGRARRAGTPAAGREARPCRRRPGRCSGRAAG